MDRLTLTCAVLGIGAILSGCGQKQERAATANSSAANTTSTASGQSGETTGIVKAVDVAAGTVTLDHQPIPSIGWPAMSMTFQANPAILGEVKAGDRVKFSVSIAEGKNEVTAISKQ